MERYKTINTNASEILELGEPRDKTSASSKYMDANFDISRYIKVMQEKLATVEKLSSFMDEIEEVMKSPSMLSQLRPKDMILFYQSLIRRANMEATLVSKFVDDSVKNSIIKKRMMVEQKKLERDEAEANRRGLGDSTTGQISKQLKNILMSKGRVSVTGIDNVEEVDFTGEV